MTRLNECVVVLVILVVFIGCHHAPDPEPSNARKKVRYLPTYSKVTCEDNTESTWTLSRAEVVRLTDLLSRLEESPGTEGLFYPNVRWRFSAWKGEEDAVTIEVTFAPDRVIVGDEVFALAPADYAELCQLAAHANESPVLDVDSEK